MLFIQLSLVLKIYCAVCSIVVYISSWVYTFFIIWKTQYKQSNYLKKIIKILMQTKIKRYLQDKQKNKILSKVYIIRNIQVLIDTKILFI